MGRGFAGGLPYQAPSEGGRPRASPEGPCGAGIGQRRGCRDRIVGAPAFRFRVASSCGRHCSALRGRTIRVVAFRASHPAKPPSRQRRFVQPFPRFYHERNRSNRRIDTSCCLMLLGLTMDNTTGGGNNENSHYCHPANKPLLRKSGRPLATTFLLLPLGRSLL